MIIYKADNLTKQVRMVNIKNKYSINTYKSSLWQKNNNFLNAVQIKENGSQRRKAEGKHTYRNENKHPRIETQFILLCTTTNSN